MKICPCIWKVAVSVFLLINADVIEAKSQDQLWLEPAAVTGDETVFVPRSLIRKRGDVKSLDDRVLVVAPAGSAETVQVGAARVVWIEPEFSDAKTMEAVQTFRAGNAGESISLLLDAVTSGPAVWRAQWLSMHLWQAAYRSQRYPSVIELVRQIDARPLSPMLMGGLPIHWSSVPLPTTAVDAARAALTAGSKPDAATLVAASWILGNSDDTQAIAALEALTRQNDRPVLAQLATIVLWRRTPPSDVTMQVKAWQATLEKMPMTLTSGPRYLVAERLEAAGDREQALTWYLAVALTPPRPHPVTSNAHDSAVRLLKELDRNEEAMKLMSSSQTPAQSVR